MSTSRSIHEAAPAASAAGSGPPVVVIIGPSASGKSSVVRQLHRQHLIQVHPTWTTRPRREDERRGTVEHRFVSEAAFDMLYAQGFFLETASAFGLPYRYGLPAVPTGERERPPDVVMLRASFVPRFAQLVPHHVVYQIEDRAERIFDRLRERACSPAELAARLDDYPQEVSAGRRMADRVFVNDGPLASLVDAVADALRVDRADTTAAHDRDAKR